MSIRMFNKNRIRGDELARIENVANKIGVIIGTAMQHSKLLGREGFISSNQLVGVIPMQPKPYFLRNLKRISRTSLQIDGRKIGLAKGSWFNTIIVLKLLDGLRQDFVMIDPKGDHPLLIEHDFCYVIVSPIVSRH